MPQKEPLQTINNKAPSGLFLYQLRALQIASVIFFLLINVRFTSDGLIHKYEMLKHLQSKKLVSTCC